MAKLRQEAQQGAPAAQFELGEAYDFGSGVPQDYATAAKWYRRAAKQGNAAAQNNLGSFYQFGLGGATNYTRAVVLYRQAAAQGYAEAQSNLAYMYDHGLGVPRDPTAAATCYRRAAEQGYPVAMLNVGVNCSLGEGPDRNLPEAFMWLDCARQLAESGSSLEVKWQIRDVLEELKQQMTPEEIQEGKKLSQEWLNIHLATNKPAP
ncbi:MAG TPA: tetratricopeptide repeat protein [Dongiaceae bacterium]|nr:tetratricopeptide repeat protein [Dongiaceae bacterium]